MRYSADFETTTEENDCRVWAVGLYCLESCEFEYSNRIDYLIEHFDNHPSSKYYFHNLKFDGEFIFYHILSNGYEFTTDRALKNGQFTALISDKGVFYSIVIKTKNGSRVEIYDSLKILPFSVKDISNAFGFEFKKGSIDYEETRPIGHILTDEEISYLLNDVKIVGEAIKVLLSQGMLKTTTASNAMFYFKSQIGKKNFERWFPELECDSFLRESYKGAFTYCSPAIAGKDIGHGIVLDVNSLYPWVMYEKFMPYGEPVKFDGEYVYDEMYQLYIIRMRCRFDIKDGMLPTIQIKNGLQFCPTDYLLSTDDEIVELTLTSVDVSLLFEHYNVHEVEWLGGYKFKQSKLIFYEYVDYWTGKKIEAGKTNNKPLRTIAKLMQNSLYGKFGLNPKADRKEPYIDDEGIVKYRKLSCQDRKTIYVPIASFITAYAREKTITTAQKLIERFLYSDTDSVHLSGDDLPDGLWIDDYELGAWKLEKEFRKARFLHAKCYVEVNKSKMYSHAPVIYSSRKRGMVMRKYKAGLSVTVAGLPSRAHKNVNWENFNKGSSFDGKLQMKHVKGGIVLKPIEFKINT